MATEQKGTWRGTEGPYAWLSTAVDFPVLALLRAVPELVLNHALAITTWDSGVYRLTEEETNAGWRSEHQVAYSPRIKQSEMLALLPDESVWQPFCECYILREGQTLGPRYEGQLYEFVARPGQWLCFANFYGFKLHATDRGQDELTELFWEQLAWIQPEGYIADGSEYLTVVHRNPQLILQAEQFVERMVRLQSEALPAEGANGILD